MGSIFYRHLVVQQFSNCSPKNFFWEIFLKFVNFDYLLFRSFYAVLELAFFIFKFIGLTFFLLINHPLGGSCIPPGVIILSQYRGGTAFPGQVPICGDTRFRVAPQCGVPSPLSSLFFTQYDFPRILTTQTYASVLKGEASYQHPERTRQIVLEKIVEQTPSCDHHVQRF